MTDAPAGSTTTASPARSRPARRSPTELTFRLDDAYVASLTADEPDWLAADRREAAVAVRALPIEPNQLYTTYLDLRAADLAEVRPYATTATARATGPHRELPEASGIGSFVEDRILDIDLNREATEAGVTIETARGLLDREPDTARRLLVEASPIPADDPLAQLTRAGWNQGVVIRVPAGAHLDGPILLRWAVGAPGKALLTRTVIELGEGAEASIVEELVASDDAVAGRQALLTGTTEVHLAADARLSVASLQELGPDQIAFQHRLSVIGEGADLHWALAQLGGRLVRSRVDNRLEGDRSRVSQAEIVFGSGEQLFDLTSYTRHVGRDTTGDLLSKGALLDSSRSYMKGLIIIEHSAHGTDSFLGEFGMNLSRSARAVAIPSLEIDQPDCRRAAHSSSVGPIDETQLFYLESRGIAPDEARKFIVLGFLEPVVARIPLPDAEARLRDLLDAKWTRSAGEPTAEGSTAA
ncbi:MAG TPA: SufD family Fe-S cluster assembly protein [Candidatus Limnocylindrales bacterium]